MITINMRSTADKIKSQGVGSCYDEQVWLVKNGLMPDFIVTENKPGKFDVVHYHTVNLKYYFERFFNKGNTVGVGYVHFLPETLDNSLKLPYLTRKIFYKYLLSFYNSMDYLVTVNPYFIERIRKYGIQNPKVCYIPNFVSTESFYPMSKLENAETRKKYNIPPDKFVVLSVGQLQARKGVYDFIETAERLPNIQFVWAGGFSFGNLSSGYTQIKKIVKNPPENVSFIGIIDRKEMPCVYNMADIMFLPSYEELFPMAILEALCCKKPVLVRDIPLYENILFDCCLKEKDVSGFARAITGMNSDMEAYQYWCDKAWECHMLYTEENALKMWRDFYKKAYVETRKFKEVSKENGKI